MYVKKTINRHFIYFIFSYIHMKLSIIVPFHIQKAISIPINSLTLSLTFLQVVLFYDYPALNSSHIFYDEKQYSTLIASMDFRALLIESSPASSESMGRNPKTSGTLIPLFVEMGENNNVYLRWISVPIKQTLSHSKSNVSVSCYVLDVISLSTHLISFLHFNHV